MTTKTWIAPWIIQSYVTLGVSLNMAGNGLIVGYTAILLPQLRRPDSDITIDEFSGSWIASIITFTLVLGNFMASPILTMFCGRKLINLISIIPMIAGWVCIILAPDVTWLLVGRSLQGLSIGLCASLAPILIGEYTSPKNRGAFLTTISLGAGSGVFFSHAMGMYLDWRTTGIIITVVAIVDLIIIISSPESPSWLINQGRYEEGRKVFRWLRGDGEEEELNSIISAHIELVKNKPEIKQTAIESFKTNIEYFKETVKKKEFYMPIFIMAHVYAICQWSGATLMASYAIDIFQAIIDGNFDIPLLVISTDIQRLISSTIGIFVIRKVGRRTLLLSTCCIAILTYLVTAAYVYARSINILPFDSIYIGIFLVHILTFTFAIGTVPLTYIIAGELFPLEYRSLSGGICVFLMSLNFFACLKSAPFLLNYIGIPGSYTIYAAITSYCMLVTWKFLPETKDRTLQDIEDEFRGLKQFNKEKHSQNDRNNV